VLSNTFPVVRHVLRFVEIIDATVYRCPWNSLSTDYLEVVPESNRWNVCSDFTVGCRGNFQVGDPRDKSFKALIVY